MNYDSVVITLILAFDAVGASASLACAWFAWLTLTDRRRTRIKRLINKLLAVKA